jgi:hypothetical protein
MGEESAGVNLIAEDRDEGEDEDEDEIGEEDEDGGWWVGTVGVMEPLDWAEETSRGVPSLGQAQDVDHGKAEDGGQAEYEPELLLDDCSAGEMAEDEWWDLEPAYSSLEGGGVSIWHPEAPQHPPLSRAARSPCLGGVGRRKLKRRPGAIADQDWEEARCSVIPQVTRTKMRSGTGDLLNPEGGCPSCMDFLNTLCRPREGSVPDNKSRNIPEVVFVRRWAVGVLGLWKEGVGWVKEGANGVSLQAT